MSSLYLVRIPIDAPRLLRFALEYDIKEDETLGYTLHAWMTALFDTYTPNPFRYFERRQEVLAYSTCDAKTLLKQAKDFALPQAWVALDPDSVASKPMPARFSSGQRLRLEVLACPVSRRSDEEKDVYLRTLERLGKNAPKRSEVYHDWLTRQWDSAVLLEHIELLGMRAKVRMLRRARNGNNRLCTVERPEALFRIDAVISEPERFQELLIRGIGRHRAFGYGMVLVAPPR